MTDYSMSAADLGTLFGITARRVTQFRDDGLLPTISRGRFDMAFLLYLRLGERRSRHAHKRCDRDTLVALGWLSGVDDSPSDEDMAAFGQLFERNGLTSQAALIAVGHAQGVVAR